MSFIDSFLNRITMYRLVLYSLVALALYTFVMSGIGMLSYGVLSLAFSLLLILLGSWASNELFAKLFRAAPNVESVWITAFILFFTLAPVATVPEAILVFFGATIAMASKYYIAIKKKHLFNPAAFALLILSITGTGLSIWWVGAPVLFPVVLILGLLIVRKIRRFDVFIAFAVTSTVVSLLHAYTQNIPLLETVSSMALSWPLVFFGTIMLTEPLTMPPSRGLRIVFGIIVGALFASQVHLGIIYLTPQLALLVGNLYAYLVSSKQKLVLRFLSVTKLTPHIYEFIFQPNQTLAYTAGQYLEWTLPHARPDTRGNRRYFTVASAPEDSEIKLGVRIDVTPSTFKKALVSLTEENVLTAGALAGDFVLPTDTATKLIFIAGGIGVTPFVSMIRHMLALNEKRDVVLFYAAASEQDFAYRDLFDRAIRELGIKLCYTTERLTEAAIQASAPDYKERMYYLSGPNAMVKNYKKLFRTFSIPRRHIKTDYFPGF